MAPRRTTGTLALALALSATGGCALVGGGGSTTPSPAAPTGQGPLPTQVPQARQQGPRPYDRVITAGAVSGQGLFRTHRIGQTLYFEIPRSELGKDMLLLRRTAAGTPQVGGQGSRIVAWEMENGRITLRDRSFAVRAADGSPIRRHVDTQTYGSYVAVFDIQAFAPDGAAVIDVTSLFTGSRGEFAGVRGMTNDRTFIESVAAFPENVNVLATQTGLQAPPGSPGGTPPVATSVRLEWSLMKLPEDPMMPRLHDSRVGFLSVAYTGYDDGHRAETRRYVRRFRLEKQDASAEVSEPVRPIVFWVDRATPEWLVPWVVRGVEEWQPAFEEAGFRNAILAKLPPDEEEDPDWSPHDARHSMIYWRASTVQNATGGQVADPRTGEILKAEVNMFHNVMNLLRNWYFIQASPIDERARSLPLPDSLMGRLVQYVVAHEVGHAIGFPHNFKASYTFPADSVRSVSFLERMGSHTPTLMDYSRFNYVAQPEDDVPLELIIPKVGPYDHFAVMWGHRPVPGARTPEDELPTLDRWARMQEDTPWFRYQTPGAINDPGNVTEAVGNADAVNSSTLALRNLERVTGMLLEAAERPGEDYSTLQELYSNAVSQWGRYMAHVVSVIGGADSQERRGTGPRFFPIERARQVEAMEFLAENAFHPPVWFRDPEILRRMEPGGVVTRIGNAQRGVVNALFSDARLNLLVEYEATAGRPEDAYTVADLAGAVRRGVWSELSASSVRIDVYRRNLQRAHLAALDRVINGSANASDARPILRGEVIELERAVARAIPLASDPATRLHLEDARWEIEALLDPSRRPPRLAAAGPVAGSPVNALATLLDAIELFVLDCFGDEDDAHGPAVPWHPGG